MTDEQLDRMIREADPFRPTNLDGAHDELLEEIMSEPGTKKRLLRTLIGAVAAAAVLAGAFALSTPDAPEQAPVKYSALALKAAEANPRLLIDEPGWKATNVYGFTTDEGSTTFANGGRSLDMNWYPAAEYAGWHEDRSHVSKPEPTTVAKTPADIFRYADTDFAVILEPRDGTFVEMRTSGTWTRATFDQVLAKIVRADVPTWLAALPPEVVKPDENNDRAAEVLAGIPLPPGFDTAQFAGLGTNDEYQFGAKVTSRVGCAWIVEWERARKAGDEAAAKAAADAMHSSHDWKVLRDMADDGGWSEVYWQYADAMAAGKEPAGYQDGLGCDHN